MNKHLIFGFVLVMLSLSHSFAQTYQVCNKDSLYGVCDEKGHVIVPKIYTAIYPCYNYPTRFVVQSKGKFGIADTSKTMVLPVEYECNMQYDNPFIIDGGQAYFDSTSTIILKKKEKYGMFDVDFKPIIPFIYDYLAIFYNYSSPTLIAKKANKYMLISKDQKVISSPDYIDFASFYTFSLYNNVFAIFKNSQQKWVFVNEQGKEFDKALGHTEFGNDTIAEKMQAVRYKNKFAAIDYQGNMVAQGFDQLSRFVPVYPDNSMLYAAFARKNKYGILRSDGKEVVPANYDHLDPVYITGEVCKFSKNGKEGIVDLNTGKELLAPVYDDIWIFGWLSGVTYVKKGEKCALINNKGELLTDFIFDDIQTYQDDLYGAKKDNKWGYIDLKGNVIIPFKYDDTEGFFNEEILPLKKGGKYGYITKQGKEITEFKYDKAERFFNREKAKIEMGLKSGWIDKKGNESWD